MKPWLSVLFVYLLLAVVLIGGGYSRVSVATNQNKPTTLTARSPDMVRVSRDDRWEYWLDRTSGTCYLMYEVGARHGMMAQAPRHSCIENEQP